MKYVKIVFVALVFLLANANAQGLIKKLKPAPRKNWSEYLKHKNTNQGSDSTSVDKNIQKRAKSAQQKSRETSKADSDFFSSQGMGDSYEFWMGLHSNRTNNVYPIVAEQVVSYVKRISETKMEITVEGVSNQGKDLSLVFTFKKNPTVFLANLTIDQKNISFKCESPSSNDQGEQRIVVKTGKKFFGIHCISLKKVYEFTTEIALDVDWKSEFLKPFEETTEEEETDYNFFEENEGSSSDSLQWKPNP